MAIKDSVFMNQIDVRRAFEVMGRITAAQYGCTVKLVKLERKPEVREAVPAAGEVRATL